MANDNKEIGDIVKKCKILLLDIEGTTTSISFVKDKLFPYAEENVKEFLENQWETSEVKEAVAALRKLAIEDKEKSIEGLVAIPGEDASKEDQIQGLVNNVKWQMSCDRKMGPLKHLQGLIWKQGFDRGDIKGHVYDDVSSALEQWHGVEGQKIYIYSSGSVQAQKLLFEKSLAGDLLPYIDGHFDTAVGPKQEVASYTAIVEKIGCKADDVLFLTDIPKEAEAARSAGLRAALVSREGNAPLPAAAAAAFAVIHTFAQLAASNKRKMPQDEQPAKVPKTDSSSDIKEAIETKIACEKTPETSNGEKATKETENMDVDDETAPTKRESKEEKQGSGIVIEDITDSNEIDIPICDTEPVVTETSDKPEIEKMETDTADKPKESTKEQKEAIDSVANEKKTEKLEVSKENVDKPVEEKGPIAEETPPVITEIEEVTADKENLAEMAEIADDIVPVVEEPKSGEVVEDLQNAGQELEKECADILTKVETVTNLDNILIRQALKPIAEESTESDNEPLISKHILEQELAIEMKRCKQIARKLTASINPKPKVVKENKDQDTNAQDEAGSSKTVSDSAQEKSEPAAEKEAPSKDQTTNKTDKMESSKENQESVKEKETEADDIKADKPNSIDANIADEKVEESNVKIEITPEETLAEKEAETPLESSVKTPSETPAPAETPIETVAKTPTETPSANSSKEADLPMETDETKPTPAKESAQPSTQGKTNNTPDTIETTKTEEKPMECSDQVNGKTNGEAEINLNGDASNDDLSTRLSVENGNGKEVNGANGDSVEAEQKGEDKKEADIKVKSVSAEERTEPVEQPTEA